MRAREWLRGGLALFLAFGAVACGDDDGDDCPASQLIVISSPSDGSEISESDDVDDQTPGIQIDVSVRSDGLPEGTEVTLTINGAVQANTIELDAAGRGTFAGVTVSTGTLTLEVEARGCVTDDEPQGRLVTDSISIGVVGEVACALAIVPAPLANEFYDPFPVLNASLDQNPALPGFQGAVEVTTTEGFTVELFVQQIPGAEASVGSETAGAGGIATFSDVTLGENTQAVRAVCTSTGGGAQGASLSTAVFVDVTAPTCTLVDPAAGVTVIPALDEDPSTPATVELTLSGTVIGDDDTAGEPTTFRVGMNSFEGSAVASNGNASGLGSFSSPGTIEVAIAGQDHAENPCTSARNVEVEMEGCEITHVAPAGVVTTDDDAATGIQTTLTVQIADECVGQTVTTNCDVSGADMTATVPAGGTTSFSITSCEDSPSCANSYMCTTRVTSPGGNETSVTSTITTDTLPPGLTFLLTDPPGLTCGDQLTEADDFDGGTPGVQIRVRLVAPGAAERYVELTNSVVTDFRIDADASGFVVVTLEPGPNALLAVATDEHGNRATSGPCNFTLADIAINFNPPVATGLLGGDDGTVGGGGTTLTLTVTGTVSEASATVTVTVDGGSPIATTVDGSGNWSTTTTVTVTEGMHTFEAQAVDGVRVGTDTVDVTVDLTPPDPPTGLTATQTSRNSADIEWTSPGGAASYEIRMSVGTAFTDGNFATTGTALVPPSPPGGAGATETISQDELRLGDEIHFGVVAYDAAGNRSSVALLAAPPFMVDPDLTGTIVSPHPPASGTSDLFGSAIAGGDLNDDGYDDLVVGAVAAVPNIGRVYVFLGGPDGIGDVPDFYIDALAVEGREDFGRSVAVLDWNGDGRDDVAIGAPFQRSLAGRVIILYGGLGTFTPGPTPVTINQSKATMTNCGPGGTSACGVRITTDETNTFFASALCGWSMVRARFDSDDRDDLVIGCIGANGFIGGMAIAYGNSTSSQTIVLDTDGLAGGARGAYLRFPTEQVGDQYGDFLANLGRTEGTSDPTDDIAIRPLGNDPKVYAIMGRSSRPAAGEMQELVFGAGGAKDFSVVGTASQSFGARVGSGPDINGDGRREILIGVPQNGNGVVHFVSGATSGADVAIGTATLLTITAAGSGTNRFGSAIANNGRPGVGVSPHSPDIDGDGIEDVVIGGGTTDRRLRVWFGDGLPSSGSINANSADYTLFSPDGWGKINQAVWIGDVNNDGLADICYADDGFGAGVAGQIEVVN